MNLSVIIILLLCSLSLVYSQDVSETRDFADDGEDYDELGRKHRKKKKHQNNPCYGGYGRTFGHPEQTYISAPVNNFFFGCGGPVVPQHQGHGHGHGGHGHGGHGHGGYGHGGHGQVGYGQYGGFNRPVNYGYNQGFQPNPFAQHQYPFNGGYNVASAASGFGNLVSGYFNRPRKVNRQINQFLRPLYNLF